MVIAIWWVNPYKISFRIMMSYNNYDMPVFDIILWQGDCYA